MTVRKQKKSDSQLLNKRWRPIHLLAGFVRVQHATFANRAGLAMELGGFWPSATSTSQAEMSATYLLHGVRCRVETEIHNHQAAFLADTDAPDA